MLCFFLSWGLWATWGHPRRPPGPLGGPDMFLGHCGLVRDCVWSSGDALSAQGGRRRRLLELKIKDFHRFPLVFIDFHWFSSISIGFH